MIPHHKNYHSVKLKKKRQKLPLHPQKNFDTINLLGVVRPYA
ncbi:hypothetical protein [Okeania sp. SIO3B5]|nr:hypothetical protein [Okeania sp. SIO3B5]